jgi:chloramphenicol O-acetyltransferase type A
MRYLDIDSWPRKKHFEVFNQFDNPHANLCANVDISALYPWVKDISCSFAVATLYLLARVANLIPEFRYRIRDDQVVIHDIVHPSMTILLEDETFSFCTIEYTQDFQQFRVIANEKIAWVKENPVLEDEPGQDDLLFMTSIPWVSFTSMMHPTHLHPVDSVPRIAWGKFFSEGDKLKMPLSVQVHHALMDGLHVGKYFTRIQEYLDQPQQVFE